MKKIINDICFLCESIYSYNDRITCNQRPQYDKYPKIILEYAHSGMMDMFNFSCKIIDTIDINSLLSLHASPYTKHKIKRKIPFLINELRNMKNQFYDCKFVYEVLKLRLLKLKLLYNIDAPAGICIEIAYLCIKIGAFRQSYEYINKYIEIAYYHNNNYIYTKTHKIDRIFISMLINNFDNLIAMFSNQRTFSFGSMLLMSESLDVDKTKHIMKFAIDDCVKKVCNCAEEISYEYIIYALKAAIKWGAPQRISYARVIDIIVGVATGEIPPSKARKIASKCTKLNINMNDLVPAITKILYAPNNTGYINAKIHFDKLLS